MKVQNFIFFVVHHDRIFNAKVVCTLSGVVGCFGNGEVRPCLELTSFLHNNPKSVLF